MTERKYTVVFADNFNKEMNKLSNTHSALLMKKLAIFRKNPFHPSFRTKKMKGGFECYESSINMDIRIFWYFQDDKIIVLTKIGHHDVVRKYKGKK